MGGLAHAGHGVITAPGKQQQRQHKGRRPIAALFLFGAGFGVLSLPVRSFFFSGRHISPSADDNK
jgi:hypothetical protein